MTDCHNPLHKKYAQAGWRMRTLAQMLTEAPDGLRKNQIEKALKVTEAAKLISDLKRKWGLEFNNGYVFEVCLLEGLTNDYKYSLTPDSLSDLNTAIRRERAANYLLKQGVHKWYCEQINWADVLAFLANHLSEGFTFDDFAELTSGRPAPVMRVLSALGRDYPFETTWEQSGLRHRLRISTGLNIWDAMYAIDGKTHPDDYYEERF